MARLTVVDLFCGAGGMSLGFSQAGFDVIFAADKNPAAIETYRRNFSHEAVLADLSADFLLPESSVIVGGPPCQGFSSAGSRRNDDPRNSLVGVFAHLVAKHRPKAFVFENVEGFLTGEAGSRIVELIKPLVAAGYRIHLKKINAANYGVPQHRKRVVAIGGLGWNPAFPEPICAAYGAPGARAHSMHLPACPTLEDALMGLPPANSDTPLQGHSVRSLSKSALGKSQTITSRDDNAGFAC